VNYEDKQALRDMRDDMTDEDDKKLLRKAVSYIYDIEHKLQAIRIFAKAIETETKTKGEEA
jgi:hypothetical protein